MLKIKEFNLNDLEKECQALQNIPPQNGFENPYYNCSYNDFKNVHANELINSSKGINLKPEYVSQTYYFLWNDDKIIGLFKIRHELNEALRTGAGHLGYAIIEEYQGKGFASKGLKLALEICKDLIKEDEVYLAVHKDNLASLKVQLNNGAYIANEDEEEYYTRIKIRK